MIITIAGGKGGTGKSMVATSLAYVFEKQKKAILARIFYKQDFLSASLNMKPVLDVFPKYVSYFEKIMNAVTLNNKKEKIV